MCESRPPRTHIDTHANRKFNFKFCAPLAAKDKIGFVFLCSLTVVVVAVVEHVRKRSRYECARALKHSYSTIEHGPKKKIEYLRNDCKIEHEMFTLKTKTHSIHSLSLHFFFPLWPLFDIFMRVRRDLNL